MSDFDQHSLLLQASNSSLEMLDDFAGHGTDLEVKQNEMFVNSLAHCLIISFLIKQLVTIQGDRT